MNDEHKTKEQLRSELAELRQRLAETSRRNAELEAMETRRKWAERGPQERLEELELKVKSLSSGNDRIQVSDIDIEWNTQKGTCAFEGLPVAMMWIDTTLAGLMSGVQSMVGTERFGLALQSEGRKSVEADWHVISQFSDFREDFKATANIAAVAGWGDWKLISLDEKEKTCRFRVWNSWEGRYQKALNVCWGSGMLAGKMAGYCSKLFETNCWAEQTTFIAQGDEYDEFVVEPSERSIEKELENLLATDEAIRADMAVALQKLRIEVAERKRAEEMLRVQRDLALALGSTHDLTEALNRMLEITFQIEGFDCGGVYLVDSLTGELNLVAHKGLSPWFVGYASHHSVDSPLARPLMAGEHVYRRFDEAIPAIAEVRRREGLRALAASPVQYEGQVIAALNLASHTHDEIPVVAREALRVIAAQIGGVIARINVEEALRSSEERFSKAFHSSPSVMAISSLKDGRYIDVNKSFSRITGYSREEAIGRTSEELKIFVTLEDRGRLIQMLEEEGPLTNVEVSVRVKTGAVRIGLFSVELVEMEGERCLLTVMDDITERVRAEEELKRYREHLEDLVEERTRELEETQAELVRRERLSALGQLTATVAHEIRNPLGTVRTAVFAIGDAIERDEMERVERALQLAERNIIRCDSIITELLDYTRERALNLEPTRVDEWLDALLDEQAIPGDIVCEKELSAGAEVPIDHEHLRRAVINVVGNAVDALQEEGKMGNQLTVSSHVVGSRLEIRVSDTGPGIPADVMEKIFEPLFSTKTYGIGLGLPIVKNIMQQHGGGVEVQSEVGQGTTITLWLPMREQA